MQFPNLSFLIELHTGIVLPALLPRAVKDRILKETFSGLYINWGVIKDAILSQLGKLSVNMKLYGFNYPEGATRKLVRPLVRIARKLRLLDVIPMGYMIVASPGWDFKVCS